MANSVYKILGQVAANGGEDQIVYTVPAVPPTNTIVSTIIVCNRSSEDKTYQLFIRKNGAVANNAQFIAFNAPVPSYDSIALTLGLTMSVNDILTANGLDDNITFSAYGTELS